MKKILFYHPENQGLAKIISKKMKIPLGRFSSRSFPDGETYLRVESSCKGMDVILVASLDQPDSKLVSLLFLSETLKSLGAKSVGLVAPYLAYMRQDRVFKKGEGITARYFAKLLSSYFDWLITIDPHLHRIHSLKEIYSIPAASIHATSLIASWLKTRKNSFLVGPDSESEQWVSEVGRLACLPYVTLSKKRLGDKNVKIKMPDMEKWKNHVPVLVDDIISSARTMIETVTQLKKWGFKPPVCIGVHGVFAGNAHRDLKKSGAGLVITCNTIPHMTNKIDVSPVLCDSITRFLSSK